MGDGGWLTTVTPAAGGGGLGSAALGTLQGGLTAAQMIASIGAGIAGNSEQRITARMLELDATSEGLASQAKAQEIRQRALRQIAEQRVAFAGSGVDISTGTPQALAEATESERDSLLGLEHENAAIRAARARLQAAAARSRGTASLATGVVNAAGAGVRYGIDIAKRG